jgi:methenyltetrahydromethanopterin cyclohydrolase
MNLNERAARVLDRLIERAAERRVAVQAIEAGGTVVDCGINAPGGLGTPPDPCSITPPEA